MACHTSAAAAGAARVSRGALLVVAVSLLLVVAPQPAFAADTVINFDEGGLANGTALMGKTIEGVTFGESPLGLFYYGGTVRATQEASEAHSPPNVLEVSKECGGFPHAEIWGRFASPRSHVALFIGNIKPNPLTAIQPVTLQGFDLSGAEIASSTVTPPKGYGVATELAINDTSERISFFKLVSVSPAECPVAIDDLRFNELPALIPPDFGLSPASSNVVLAPGSSFSQTLTVHRTSTSTGPISLAISGLPSDVSASFSENPATGPNGSTIKLTLTAAADSPSESSTTTVTGTPSPSAGTQPRSVSFGVSVAGPVELRAQGLDVTQGILDNNYLLVPSGIGSGMAYRGFGFSPPDFSEDPLPGESPLVEGNRTVVRFYADAHGASSAGVYGVGAALSGSRNGVPLPGSPLMADYGPQWLPDTGEEGGAPVFLPERISDRNAYTFTLPASWTSGPGPITLTGTLIAPTAPSFNPVTICATAACKARDSFTLTGVTFVHLPTMLVAPVQIIQPKEPQLPSPQSLYSRALLTEPGGAGYTVEPYVATLDPTDVIKNPKKYDPGGDENNGYLQLLENFGQQYAQGVNPRPDLVSGVNLDQRGVTPCCHSTYDYPAVGFDLVYANRPLTSVGHELGHDLGRNHADDSEANGKADGSGSKGCGGGGGKWPPDGVGYIQGIGLDMSFEPYRILYPGLPGEPAQWYDKMSYCTSIDCPSGDAGTLKPCTEPNTWTSPYGWLHSISALWLYGKKVGRTARNVRGAATAMNGERGNGAGAAGASYLVVSGVLDSAGARITSVVPTTTPMPQPATSPFKLSSLDRAGHILGSANLFPQLTHDDPGPAYLDFEATVPARSVGGLEVTANGSVVAKLVRPARAPRVKVLSPSRRAVLGGRRSVTVRWRASEPGARNLTIVVEYSATGGRDWHAIYLGPNRGQARLPSWYFAGSRNARVRIIASDGFNQGSAVSSPFTALGSPPQVLITSPGRGFQIAGDARLQLTGQAFDQQLRLLSGRRLHWFDGSFSLGYGAALSAQPLPPGRNVIRLVARDAAGRTATATLTVLVADATPQFLHLHIPARVSARARNLTIAASAAGATTLTVNGRHFQLTSKSSRLTLPINRGRTAVLLQMTVNEQGFPIPFAAKVNRG